MLIEENKGLSVVMHAVFSPLITNPTNHIGLSDFKELQNTALKPQSTVFRHCVWAAKRMANSSKHQYFEAFFPHLSFAFKLFFISKNRTSEQKKMVQKDARTGAEGFITLKFDAFEVELNSMGSCQ